MTQEERIQKLSKMLRESHIALAQAEHRLVGIRRVALDVKKNNLRSEDLIQTIENAYEDQFFGA